MRITSKYVLREHLGPLTFALAALTSLLLLNYIARRFGELVGKGLPWQAIVEFFVLSIPFTVAMTLPMAVLVATLYAFSRLAAENEITAFKASGVAMTDLLGPVVKAAVVVAVLMVGFNDQVLSRANHRLSQLLQDISRTKPTFVLDEQVINEVTPSFLLRAGRVDQTRGTMRDVTIYDLSQQSARTIQADSGALAFAPNGKDIQLTLYDGSILQVGDGRPEQLQRIYYTTNLVRVKDVANQFTQTDSAGSQFSYKSDREMSVCELSDAYLRARRSYLEAELELAQAIADSLGKPRPTSTPRRRVLLGLGRIYCNAINALKVPTASAAEVRPQPPAAQPPAAQPPAAQPPAAAQPPRDTARRTPADTQPRPTAPTDTARRRAPGDTVRPATPVDTTRPAQPVPATPVPAQPVPGTPFPAPPGTVPGAAQSIPPGGIPAVPAPPVPGVPVPSDTSAAAAPVVATPLPPDTGAAGLAPSMGMTGSMIAIARIRAEDMRTQMNGYVIEIHKKFALAVACIVFVLLGAPIALRFPRGGVGLVIGVSLFVFAAYYSFLIAGEELAQRGYVPPSVAMWAANVVFGLAGVALAARMGRESGSARGGGLGELLYNLRARFRRPRAA